MLKFRCLIDDYPSKAKPKDAKNKGHVSQVKNRIINGTTTPSLIDAEELANYVSSGHAITPAILSGGASAKNWTSQQVFMIDIDNKNDVLKVEDALKLCGEIQPAFIYSTFSSSEDCPRYRIVFIANAEITDINRRNIIQNQLFNMFGDYADKQCLSADTTFYGGKKILYSNYDSTFDINDDMFDCPYIEENTLFDTKDISIEEYIKKHYPESIITKSGKTANINPCPFCGHYDHFKINLNNNTFCAYGDEDLSQSGRPKAGTIINFVMYEQNITKDKAIELLNQEYNITPIYNTSGKFQHDKFADYLKDKYHIVMNNHQLYAYIDGYYCLDDENSIIEKIMQREKPDLKKHQRNEVYSTLMLTAENKEFASPELIVVNNGILNIKTLELMPFNHEYFIPNKINLDYREFDCPNEFIDKLMLDFVSGDKETLPILYEYIAYSLIRDNRFKKMFIIHGDGGCGKTTYFYLVRCVLGDANCSNTTLDKFDSKKRFGLTQINGKLANIGDDCPSSNVADISIIKQLTGESHIEIEYKFKDVAKLKSYTKMLFSFNELPKLNESGSQIKIRLIVLPFTNHFNSNGNNDLKDKINSTENLEYILYKSVQAINHVLKVNEFTQSAIITKSTNEYLTSLDPTEQFIIEHKDIFNNKLYTCDDVYRRYEKWCIDNYFEYLNKIGFGKRVSKLGYQAKQRDDKKRYYKKI